MLLPLNTFCLRTATNGVHSAMCAVRLCAAQAASSASKQPKQQARRTASEDNGEGGMTTESATEDDNMVAEMMKVDWQVINRISLALL